MEYDVVGFDGGRQCHRIGKIPQVPFHAVKSLREQAATAKGANSQARRGKPAAQISAYESTAAEYDARDSAQTHFSDLENFAAKPAGARHELR
jgi:hypothetical protein